MDDEITILREIVKLIKQNKDTLLMTTVQDNCRMFT